LSKALEITPTTERDLVVLTVRVSKGPHTGYEKISADHLFTSYEQLLFSKVVALAEKAGKTVHLLVIPSSNIFEGSAHAAAQLESVEVIAGRSAALKPREQARRFGQAWEKLPAKPQHQIRFVVIDPDGNMHEFPLGAHVPG
jgi:glucose/arabinose dehydrogenase